LLIIIICYYYYYRWLYWPFARMCWFKTQKWHLHCCIRL